MCFNYFYKLPKHCYQFCCKGFYFLYTFSKTSYSHLLTYLSFQIALANLFIVAIGFAPYGFFALWALFNHGSQMTMLASVIPPVVAKLSTAIYPVVYIVASKSFRAEFAARTIGICYDKKAK